MLPGPWGTQILQDQFRSRAWRRSVGYSVPVRIQKHWHEVCTFLWVTKQFVSGNDAWDSAGTPKEGGILSPTCGQGWWRFSCWTESSARTYQPLAWANFPHAQVLETNLQIAAFDADLLQSWTLRSAEVCRSVFFLDPDLHLIHYAIGVIVGEYAVKVFGKQPFGFQFVPLRAFWWRDRWMTGRKRPDSFGTCAVGGWKLKCLYHPMPPPRFPFRFYRSESSMWKERVGKCRRNYM